jgi:hypothetical protein
MIDVVEICEVFFPANVKPSHRRAWMFDRFDAIFSCSDKWYGAVYIALDNPASGGTE